MVLQKAGKTGMPQGINRAQSGICAETSLHGLVLLLNAVPQTNPAEKLARIPALCKSLDERFSEALLSTAVAFGEKFWARISPRYRPRQLAAFPELGQSHFTTSPHDFDMAVILRSDKMDANYFAGRVLLEWFSDMASLEHSFVLFHYLDDRNLFGFTVAPDNPHGSKRREVALLTEDDDPQLALGSYLYVQHYRLDIDAWQQLPVEQQRQIMGREKVSGKPWPGDRPGHASKAALSLSEGSQPVLIWQQMPVADMQQHSQLDMLWSRSPAAMEKWLERRYVADAEGHCDPLLNYMEATLSASFFAPPTDWFVRLNPGK